MSDQSREEVDAKIAASEARAETKMARLEGKLDLILTKLDGAKDDSRLIRANQWVIGLGLAFLIVAVVALFPVFFGVGTQVKDIIDHDIDTHKQSAPK